jgi:hypothetical protein
MSPILSARGGLSAGAYGWGAASVAGVASFESIATTTGSGSSGAITFSSIPGTFKHLQIRFKARQTQSGRSDLADFWVTFNGSSAADYSYHNFLNNGGSISSQNGINQTYMVCSNALTRGASTADTFGFGIIDILDYASTSKNKTLRYFGGSDAVSSIDYGLALTSANWRSTSAITSITLTEQTGFGNITTTSNFALYGIKEFT